MAPPRATPIWLGPPERPLWAWLHEPARAAQRGVVLCPPLGYEAWCTYQTYRRLAFELAAAGCAVLRLDYDGVGSSAGHYTDPGRVAAWTASVVTAVAALRARGIGEIGVVGLRFGAALALAAAAAAPIDQLVLWDPVVSGKRYARELKAYANTGSAADPDAPDDGLLGVSGTVYTKDTLAELAKSDMLALAPVATRRVLILERDDKAIGAALGDALRARGGISVEQRAVGGMAQLLEVDNEGAVVPLPIVDAIVRELAGAPADAPALPIVAAAHDHVPRAQPAAGAVTLQWPVSPEAGAATAAITEAPVTVGPYGLFAMLGQPAGAPATKLVIFFGGGTEHQVGPGRIWVEFARTMNARGLATLRADVDGIGDSPLRGAVRTPNSYDPEHVVDAMDFVAFGRARGFAKIVLVGLCSGAWLAVHAALDAPVDGVYALNPQLYWEQGDPVYPSIAEFHAKQQPDRARERYWDRYHLWSALDVLGLKSAGMRWLERLVARRVRTHVAFAEADEGWESLHARNRRRLGKLLQSPLLTLEEMAGVDHGIHRFRKRAGVLAKILAFVDAV